MFVVEWGDFKETNSISIVKNTGRKNENDKARTSEPGILPYFRQDIDEIGSSDLQFDQQLQIAQITAPLESNITVMLIKWGYSDI
jgi:hypothetical protein